MSKKFKLIFLLPLFFSLPSLSSAEDITESILTTQEKSHADVWGLNANEYKRYKKILTTPRAYFTPDLDKNPLLALALEAESDSERAELADRWVKIQYSNNIKTFAWQKEVGEAWERNFPSVPKFSYKDPATSRFSISNITKAKASSSNFNIQSLINDKPRAQLFISIDNCEKCVSVFDSVYKSFNKGVYEGIDLFFVGNPSKFEIQGWASSNNLNAKDVNELKLITLNLSPKVVVDLPLLEFD